MYRIDKRYAHKRLMRAGARIKFHRYAPDPFRTKQQPPEWRLAILDPCQNGDGGVLYSFVRKGRKWQCYGIGRLRYADNRDMFADKMPTHGPCHIVRADGKWWLADQKTGELISGYTRQCP